MFLLFGLVGMIYAMHIPTVALKAMVGETSLSNVEADFIKINAGE